MRVVFFLAFTSLLIYGLIELFDHPFLKPLVKSVLRHYKIPLTPLTGGIIGEIIVVVSILFSITLANICSKRSDWIKESLNFRGVLLALISGVLLGVVLTVGQYFLLAICGYYSTNIYVQASYPWAAVALYYTLVAIAEEILFRGYVLQTLETGLGTTAAVVISSALFACVHLINIGPRSPWPNTGWTLYYTMSMGLAFAAQYVVTRRLWLSIATHFSWDLMSAFLAGIPNLQVKPWFICYFHPVELIFSVGIIFLVVAAIFARWAIRVGNWRFQALRV